MDTPVSIEIFLTSTPRLLTFPVTSPSSSVATFCISAWKSIACLVAAVPAAATAPTAAIVPATATVAAAFVTLAAPFATKLMTLLSFTLARSFLTFLIALTARSSFAFSSITLLVTGSSFFLTPSIAL